jgi:hypothetical protein
MYQIKSPTGYVSRLKELGYTVEEPKWLRAAVSRPWPEPGGGLQG